MVIFLRLIPDMALAFTHVIEFGEKITLKFGQPSLFKRIVLKQLFTIILLSNFVTKTIIEGNVTGPSF